jgi:hypothetical protein
VNEEAAEPEIIKSNKYQEGIKRLGCKVRIGI